MVGDGKLGLLVAGVTALRRPKRLVHFGRHQHKLDLIPDTDAKVVLSSDQDLPAEWEQVRRFSSCPPPLTMDTGILAEHCYLTICIRYTSIMSPASHRQYSQTGPLEIGSQEEMPAQAFDVCIEASGSSRGIKLALALVRPMGTVVQKSTCSAVGDAQMPAWSDIANDVVVNEKRLVGSRHAFPICFRTYWI